MTEGLSDILSFDGWGADNVSFVQHVYSLVTQPEIKPEKQKEVGHEGKAQKTYHGFWNSRT
jgi:hypothetical protein